MWFISFHYNNGRWTKETFWRQHRLTSCTLDFFQYHQTLEWPLDFGVQQDTKPSDFGADNQTLVLQSDYRVIKYSLNMGNQFKIIIDYCFTFRGNKAKLFTCSHKFSSYHVDILLTQILYINWHWIVFIHVQIIFMMFFISS